MGEKLLGSDSMKEKRSVKQLKDMDLIDDFLFTQLISSPDYGEDFARILLETLLQKKIGKITVRHQQMIQGANSDLRGARLDVIIEENTDGSSSEKGEVFDIEAEKDFRRESVKNLPWRVRFYHAKLDSRYLKSGAKFGDLPNVYILMITTFDPFGENRMLYTARTRIEEDPSIPYEDGARTLFFYTKGNPDGIQDPVRQLLHYMDNTTTENAITPKLKKVDEMVHYIKHDEQMEELYMKTYEREEWIREEGWEDGRIEILTGLVKDGVITAEEAARRAEMTEKEFQEAAERLKTV